MSEPLTNAQFLYLVSRLCRTAAKATAELTEGVWNPDFNSADGTDYARSICEDVREWLDRVESRLDGCPPLTRRGEPER